MLCFCIKNIIASGPELMRNPKITNQHNHAIEESNLLRKWISILNYLGFIMKTGIRYSWYVCEEYCILFFYYKFNCI